MARKTAAQAKAPKYAEVDDGILDSDSEADEFENYNAAGIKRQYEDSDGDDSDEAEDDSGSEDGGEGFAGIEDSDEEQGDGVGVWEPDNWDGNDDTDSESESGSDDEAAMVSLLSVCYAWRSDACPEEAQEGSEGHSPCHSCQGPESPEEGQRGGGGRLGL